MINKLSLQLFIKLNRRGTFKNNFLKVPEVVNNMSHINYIVKRLLQILPVLLCVTILIFAMMRLIPGDPARIQLGENAREAAVQALRLKMGLDEPLITQYFIFMKQLITLDLGTSLLY